RERGLAGRSDGCPESVQSPPRARRLGSGYSAAPGHDLLVPIADRTRKTPGEELGQAPQSGARRLGDQRNLHLQLRVSAEQRLTVPRGPAAEPGPLGGCPAAQPNWRSASTRFG